jgi:hypothetical protein
MLAGVEARSLERRDHLTASTGFRGELCDAIGQSLLARRELPLR